MQGVSLPKSSVHWAGAMSDCGIYVSLTFIFANYLSLLVLMYLITNQIILWYSLLNVTNSLLSVQLLEEQHFIFCLASKVFWCWSFITIHWLNWCFKALHIAFSQYLLRTNKQFGNPNFMQGQLKGFSHDLQTDGLRNCHMKNFSVKTLQIWLSVFIFATSFSLNPRMKHSSFR